MSDIDEGIASTEAAEGRHTYNFKWCPKTELAFLRLFTPIKHSTARVKSVT
jgi:hypothetical protein